MDFNRDLAYSHLDEAEKILAHLKFKVKFYAYPAYCLENVALLKSLITEVEKILSEDATEGGDKDAE